MELIRIIGRYAKPYTGAILGVIVLQLVTALATLYLSLIHI